MPNEWIDDPVLGACSDDAELLLRRLCSCVDAHWRFFIDPGNPAHSVRVNAFAPARRFADWHRLRLQRSLSELLAAGILTYCHRSHRHWYEVHERYRYVRGREAYAIEAEPEQMELLQEPLLMALPSPSPPGAPAERERAKRSKQAKPVNNSAKIRIRAESEKKRPDPESGPAAPVIASGEVASLPAETQEQAAGEKGSAPPAPERFARWKEAFPQDPVWAQLCAELGRAEMLQNGASWAKRWRLCRDALNTALSDWLRLTPESKRAYPNSATYLTTAFENEKRKFA